VNSFDPIKVGQEIVISYGTEFMGNRNVVFSNLIHRYGDPTRPKSEKIKDFIKMKGPFMQALPISTWGTTSWENFANSMKAKYAVSGIDGKIVDLFRDKIKRLYAHQEDAIRSILEDKHTLIVASTGRGKTEAWLIPILQFILIAKRNQVPNHPPNSVKALLVYPTKALAQDQLKRLIKYLYRLNKKIPANEQVTIGIFDGDTPNDSRLENMAYLSNAFKYFKCPDFDSSKAICRGCDEKNNHSLCVLRDEEESRVKMSVPRPECRHIIPLDFVYLTREDIVYKKVDILLTNPDTINYRAININADTERRVFIQEPKYIVLDEIHTLKGIFGSFVSMLMKRLKLIRKQSRKENDDLRIVAGSATIKNESEVFSKINPFSGEFQIVEERTSAIQKPLPPRVPDYLQNTLFVVDDILKMVKRYAKGDIVERNFLELFKSFQLDKERLTKAEDDEELEVLLKENFFESLTSEIEKTPQLNIFRAVHSSLLKKPCEPEELMERLKKQYFDLTDETVQRVLKNVFTIAELSGILESRIHLFSWPLDGFYTCINCGKIFDTPREECDRCYHHFVTRLVVCGYCGEEAVESWFCPQCEKLYPFKSNVEGEPVFFEPFKCNCTGEENLCIRVVWKPYFRCPRCGIFLKQNSRHECEICGSEMMLNESTGDLQCINQHCGFTKPLPAMNCPKCHSTLELVAEEALQCPACGRTTHSLGEILCSCGATMHPVLYLPWVCNNSECGEVFTSERPPSTCKCGSRTFFLAGLFDVQYAYYCEDCKKHFIKESCGHIDHSLKLIPSDFTSYRLVDSDFRIRKPFPDAKPLPCYHPYIQYLTSRRYLPLVRSPANVAVTSAQYALRNIIGHADFDEIRSKLKIAKILSFADSRRDMEQLNRDFQEPEQQLFIDQLLVDILEKGDRTLSDLYPLVIKEVQKRQQIYGHFPKLIERLRIRSWQRKLSKEELLKTEVDRRLFPGVFYGVFRSSPRLVSSTGIIDIELALDETTALTKDEELILRELQKMYKRNVGTLHKNVSKDLRSTFDDVLNGLELRGFVVEEQGIVRINPKKIIVRLVSEDKPILFNPRNGNFYPTIAEQLNEDIPPTIHFNLGYKERTMLFSPYFSRIAYRLAYSSPLMLLSEPYKGTTEKTKRRELEYRFKNGLYPNFLSSGPAMELGIDVGDLNILSLFGTPPNINSYLQRIGRAGRETKKALIFSVSKRNPIDYYYYKQPSDLIQSTPQPIPLNEHNPEVIRISLVWALMDFIANNFWVPWREYKRPTGSLVTDGEEVVRIEESALRPDDIKSFTWVYNRKCEELKFGERLQILAKIIKDNRLEAKNWLLSLLDYSFCTHCSCRYPSTYRGECLSKGCSGKVEVAKEKFAEDIDYSLHTFGSHLVSLAIDFLKQLRKERRNLEKKEWEIEDRLDETEDEDTRQKLQMHLMNLKNQIDGFRRLSRNLGTMRYSEFHRRYRESKYAFNLRSIQDEVDIKHFKYNQKTGRFIPFTNKRDITMAIKESHPYGISVLDGQKNVACRFVFDEWKTKKIKDAFPDKLICPSCQQTYDDLQKSRCDLCGLELKLLETIVPRTIELYPDNYLLREHIEEGKGWLNPLDIHALTEYRNTVERTFPHIDNRVIKFEPIRSFYIKDQLGNSIGSIQYGQISLAILAKSYNSMYERGFRDHTPRCFELCGVEGCNSVVVQRGSHLCAMDHNHDPSTNRYVQLGYIFDTYGMKISCENGDKIISHTIAHGFRMALQKIAGVTIRNILEAVGEDCAYVYDSEVGGSGVTALLMKQEDGDYPNLESAFELIKKHFSNCRCKDGCPHCVYQYGCVEHNSPRTLSRKRTNRWMSRGLIVVGQVSD